MSDKEDKGHSNTVFIEGESVVTTSSPYEKFRDAEFEYVSKERHQPSGNQTKRTLRLECIKLSTMLATNDSSDDSIIDRAKRFYEYIKSGE